VGASAGGLEAFTELLRALPVDTGVAYVLVQHLAPTHESVLAEILAHATAMPVVEVRGEPEVEPNRVYVIPPDRNMVLVRGHLQLLRREAHGRNHPIDRFFRSLAESQGRLAIGVVLSGTATDGTLGLEEIKAGGGITFAQDSSARYDGMPRSAAGSGCVDFVLPPAGIAAEIARIATHPLVLVRPAARATRRRRPYPASSSSHRS
jgi:two-component system CheB/CheR fusion protein